MGKLLETLKPHERGSVPAPASPSVAAELPAEAVEEVPFIEVGGRRGPVEGSPAVLASMVAPPLKAVGRGRAESGPRFQQTAATAPDASGLTVAFRPLVADARVLPPPQTRFAPELVVFHRPETPAARQYQALANTLTGQLPAGHSAVLFFVAATRGVGATTVLLNLAITFARHGRHRVAVVDADLWGASVAGRFGLHPGPGLREVLHGTVMLHQALQETGEPNLLALTVGEGGMTPSPGRLTVGVAGVARQLREQFDLILLDAPCVQERPEIIALATASDAVYVVVPQSAAETGQTAALVRSLTSQGSPLRGQILTER
jgi:Mrp family chromosome partitioning ATPase